jgi:histidinol phosphatase-like PHP family hydrolase
VQSREIGHSLREVAIFQEMDGADFAIGKAAIANEAPMRRAIEAGVRLGIDSDAHSPGDLRSTRLDGISAARRGRATKSDIVNPSTIDRLLQLRHRMAA